jgi:hypothetical protein
MKEIKPSIKAIFATGFMAPQIEAQLAKGELGGVILKPYQLDDVLEKISTAIRESVVATTASIESDDEDLPLALPSKTVPG